MFNNMYFPQKLLTESLSENVYYRFLHCIVNQDAAEVPTLPEANGEVAVLIIYGHIKA